MFFLTTLNQNIFISSQYFSGEIRKKLISTLLGTVEGCEAHPFGTILIVTEICKKIGKGKLIVGSPSALYNLTYRAITFRTFKGEVFDSIITSVTNIGFFSEAGFLEVFVSRNQIPLEFLYKNSSKAFLSSKKPENHLSKDTIVRVRILSVTNQKNPNHVLGTINGPFLGFFEI